MEDKSVFTEDDCAPDSLEHFIVQLESIGVNFNNLKSNANRCLNSEPDEIAFFDGKYLLYQDAYDQVWILYKAEEINSKSHLHRFIK